MSKDPKENLFCQENLTRSDIPIFNNKENCSFQGQEIFTNTQLAPYLYNQGEYWSLHQKRCTRLLETISRFLLFENLSCEAELFLEAFLRGNLDLVALTSSLPVYITLHVPAAKQRTTYGYVKM
jgi:hypothetical protein